MKLRERIHGKRVGKSAAMQRMLAEYIKQNPKATVARVTPQGTFVEKPVEGENIGLPLLPLLDKDDQ